MTRRRLLGHQIRRPVASHVGAAILIMSVPPEILEPRLAQGGVARGVGDRDVAEPVLDRAGVDTVIGERLRFTRAALAPPFLNLARVPCGLGAAQRCSSMSTRTVC